MLSSPFRTRPHDKVSVLVRGGPGRRGSLMARGRPCSCRSCWHPLRCACCWRWSLPRSTKHAYRLCRWMFCCANTPKTRAYAEGIVFAVSLCNCRINFIWGCCMCEDRCLYLLLVFHHNDGTDCGRQPCMCAHSKSTTPDGPCGMLHPRVVNYVYAISVSLAPVFLLLPTYFEGDLEDTYSGFQFFCRTLFRSLLA